MKSDSRRSGGLSVLDQLQRSTSKLGAVELEQSHELREFGDDTGARISGGIQSGTSAAASAKVDPGKQRDVQHQRQQAEAPRGPGATDGRHWEEKRPKPGAQILPREVAFGG